MKSCFWNIFSSICNPQQSLNQLRKVTAKNTLNFTSHSPCCHDYQLIENQIKKWSDTNNKSKIAQLFRRIDLTEDKKLPIKQVRLIMKDCKINLDKKFHLYLIFNKNDTEYFFTTNTKKYLRDKEKTLLL